MVKQENVGFFKSKEDVVSMFLGLVVVVAVVGFIVNYIEKRKGTVDVPGVSNDLVIENIQNEKETENGNFDTIIVQKNDNLWKIAEKVYGDGFKWTEISKANNLKEPGLLVIGQKLLLPKIDTNTVADGKGEVIVEKSEYVVVKGDTLWNIATKVYGDGYKWTKIWQDNRSKLNSPDMLEIGMKLLVYGKI